MMLPNAEEIQKAKDAEQPAPSEELPEKAEVETAEVEATEVEETNAQNEQKSPEELARQRGWKPKEEWVGKIPDGFVDDPEEYNRRHEDSVRNWQKKSRELETRLERQEQRFAQEFDKLEKFHQNQLKAEREAADRKLAEAFNKGDAKAYSKALSERDALLAEQTKQAKAAEPQQQQTNPNFEAWYNSSDAEWYKQAEQSPNPDSDPKIVYGQAVAMRLQRSGLTPEAGPIFYETISAEVRKAFPESGKVTAPEVEGESKSTPTRKKARTWDSLPAEVRNAPETKVMLKRAYKGDKAKFAEVYYAGEQ